MATNQQPNLALRRRVAAAVGWTDLEQHFHDEFEWIEGIPPDDRVPDMDCDSDEVPAYELDIAAAWALVKAMVASEDVADVSVHAITPEDDDDQELACCEMTRWMGYKRLPGATASNPERAICLMYLLHKEATDAE
jgi:hypothetical protein